MTIAAPVQPAAPQRGLKALLARHPLVSFFVMAFAFSWIVWSPWVLSEDGLGLLPYKLGDAASGLLNAAAILLGPTVSAFIMTATTEGRAGIRRLLRRIVLWRVGLRWYLFAFIGVPAILVLGSMVILRAGLASFEYQGAGYMLSYLITFIYVLFLGGPLFEEIGWRGFALPRLCAAAPAAAAWSLGWEPHPGTTVGTVAPAHVYGLLFRRRIRRQQPPRARQVLPLCHRHDHHIHVGFQQHERQRASGHLVAHVHRLSFPPF
jgi:membrane protease YdiL (CAAX protease family)